MIDQQSERCPLNAPGTFYTKGDCMACGAPEAEAPDLLAPLDDDNLTTYFVRQPETPDEVDRACSAICVCCVADLRYGGIDRAIIERLGNDPGVCDYVVWGGKVVPGKLAGGFWSPLGRLFAWVGSSRAFRQFRAKGPRNDGLDY